MAVGASSTTAGMTLGVLSVLAEISIVSDSARQLKYRFLQFIQIIGSSSNTAKRAKTLKA